MSDFDPLGTSDLFDGIMAANYQSGMVANPAIVAKDFKRMALNFDEGEQLHEALRQAHRIARGLPKWAEVADDDVEAGKLVCDAMNVEAVRTDVGDAFENLFAVQGKGIFCVRDPESGKVLNTVTLNDELRIFGVLDAIAYARYFQVAPSVVDRLSEEGGKPSRDDLKPYVGGLISMTSVELCNAAEDGLGEVYMEYPSAIVPIEIDGFQWARAYPIA